MSDMFYEIGTISAAGCTYRVGVTHFVGPDRVQLYQGSMPYGNTFLYEYGRDYEDPLHAKAANLIFDEIYRKRREVTDFDPILIEA
jgi:hypothetical protein